MSIKVKIGGSRSIRAAPKQDTNRPIVAQGQQKAIIEPDSVTLGIDTVGNYVRDLDAGAGIVVTPETDTESANLVISHAATTTETSTANDPLDFPRNISIDQFGHITAFENQSFWPYHFTANNNIIRVADFTIGSTSFSVGEQTDNLQGLNSLNVGELTFTQGQITGTDDIRISPTFDGVVDINNHRIVNILDPIDAQDVVNRRYLDDTIDDLTISFRVVADPVDPTDPANKRYVDRVQVDILQKQVAIAATTADLGGTYAENPFDPVANTNVSSTITIPAQLILNIDGVVNWDIGDAILVKDQTDAKQNGRYEIKEVGDNINEWVLQRGPYTDATQEIAGYPVYVTGGNTYAKTAWVATVDDPVNFALDTDDITYLQFQGTGIDGRGLTLDQDVFNVDYTQTFDNIIGKDDSLIITSNLVDVNSVGGFILPVGETDDRPTPQQGMIRYNTTDNQFEGYKGTAWAGLGGVIDVDQDTRIIAESSAGADNDQLQFYTAGNLGAQLDSDGTFKVYDRFVIPVGTTAERLAGPLQGSIRYNTTDNQFEGYNGTVWSGLGGVIDANQDTYIIAETGPGVNNDQLDFYTAGQHRLRIDSDGTIISYGDFGLSSLTQNRVVFVGAGGTLVDSNNFIFDGSTLTVNGNADITGNLSIGGNLTLGNANTDNISVVADFTSDLLPDNSGLYDLGTIGKNWNRLFTPTLKSDTGVISIDEIGAFKLPVGATGDRPSPLAGMIRFNSTDGRFEGYDGSIWSGLAGSVQDVDQDTKILAELNPDDDTLRFYTAGVERYQVRPNGDIGFGSDFQKVIINYNTGELNVNTKITSDADLFLEANGAVNASGTKITNVANPTANTDVVTYDYLENGSFARTLTVTEYANTYVMDLLENTPTIDVGLGLNADFANNILQVKLARTGVTSGRYGNDGFSPRFTVDGFGRIIDVTEVPFQLQSNAILEFEEASQDITASQFRFGTHQGISFSYNDNTSNGTIDATVDNFVLTLGGDVSGSNTVVSVSDTVIPVTITADYVVNVAGDANGTIEVFHTQGAGSTPIIKHGDTSTIADTTVSLPNTVQGLTFDEFGHVQSIVTVDLDTRYVPNFGGTFTGNIFAPRYYDSDDNTYFGDFAGTSRLNSAIFGTGAITQLQFTDGAGYSTLYAQSGNIGFLNSAFNYAAYADKSASNWVVPEGDVQAERFVDFNNNAYFLNPAGTDSNLNEVTIENDLHVEGQINVGSGGNILQILNDRIIADQELFLDSNDGLINVLQNRILNLADPVNDYDASNKRYVDSVAQGLRVIPSALAATTSDLGATFNQFQNTLTASINGAFSVDGVTSWSVGDRVLVKDQTNAAENGSYIVTTVGNGTTPWKLTRGEYFNETSEIPGSFQFVTDGTVNNGTGWVAQVDDAETFAINTDDVNWYQFSGAGSYTAGYGLTLTGTEFRITNPFINFNADTGTTDEVRLGEAISFIGGEGIDTSVSNNQITIAGELASTTNIGVAQFAAANFAVSAGVVTVAELNGGTF